MIYDASFGRQPLSKVLDEFRDIADRSAWDRRLKSVDSQLSRLTAAGWLWHLYRPMDFAFWKSVREAEGDAAPSAWDAALEVHKLRFYNFLYAAVATYRKLGPAGRNSLEGALRDAAGRGSDGLGPVAHEILTARDLMGVGFDVQFVDLELGGLGSRRTYDFLLRRDGREVAEVECKHTAGDGGRQIHAEAAHALADRLAEWLNNNDGVRVASALRSKLVVPNKLSSDNDDQAALCEFVGKALLAGRGSKDGPSGSQVKIGRDKSAWKRKMRRRSSRAIERGTQFDVTWAGRAEGCYGFEYFNESAGKRVALSVESQRADKPRNFQRRLIEKAVGGSKSQFTKTLPGLLFCHLRYATSRDMRSWEQRDFLDDSVWRDLPRWEHLHSVVFTAPGDLIVEQAGNGPFEQKVERVVGYQLANPNGLGSDDPLLADLGTPLT